METTPVVIVALDDDQPTLDLISEALSGDKRLVVYPASNPDEGLNLVLTHRPKIVLLGMTGPSTSGMDLLEKIVGQDPGIDVMLMTGHYSTESALEAIQRGACDYITKPVCVEELRERLHNLVGSALARRRTLQLDRELAEAFRFEGMVGRSPLMLDVYARIARIARHFRTALISGATGTGKELAARALHARSPVHNRPFVAFNCAAMVDTLVESELFGHVKGAFTGAVQERAGLFEHANGGTVFLDEIGDMAMGAQAKLLRVVQNQELQRVGSSVTKKVDVRIIAATNRDLQMLMQKQRFREDLYYRIATVHIRLPLLTERREDLPFLQREFVERFATHCGKNIRGITRRAQAVLNRHPWPGNVRELENVLAHACMMADHDYVDVGDLPDYIHEPKADLPAQGLRSLEEMDRRYARRVVSRVGGNKVKAAEILGISRATLYRMLADEPSPKNT